MIDGVGIGYSGPTNEKGACLSKYLFIVKQKAKSQLTGQPAPESGDNERVPPTSARLSPENVPA